MNFHIIIDHPWEKSFNFAILEAAEEAITSRNHTADILDLNRDGFDPIMREEELALYAEGKYLDPKVEEYQRRLYAADHVIFIFPIWWNVMPVMLKGWMDKVLLPGFAFTTDQVPEPLLGHIRGATVLTTTGTPDDFHREEHNNALKWAFCKGTLAFCGIKPSTWLNFGETGFASREAHAGWREEVREYISGLCA